VAVTAGVANGQNGAATPRKISQCTASAVANAVAQGGSWVFACSGTVAIPTQIRVDKGQNVTLDGTGQHVTLTSGLSKPTAFSRIFFVNGGTLHLVGLTLTGRVQLKAAKNGSSGGNGTDGGNGGANQSGAAGTDGVPGAKGKNGNPARGGTMVIGRVRPSS
jgi:hypothetical protein